MAFKTLLDDSGSQPAEKKENGRLVAVIYFIFGMLGGMLIFYITMGLPAQKKAAAAESKKQEVVNSLVRLAGVTTCDYTQTPGGAKQIESLVTDTLKENNIGMPASGLDKMDSCISSLQHPMVEGMVGPGVNPHVRTHQKKGKKKGHKK